MTSTFGAVARATAAGLAIASLVFAGDAGQAAQHEVDGPRLYRAIRDFALTGGSAEVTDFVLVRDRVHMTFTGTFYLAGTIENRVTGAVFIGRGSMRAEVPPSEFERDHVRRMINADVVESDFRTAVLRWTDDTFDRLAPMARGEGGVAPREAQRLASAIEPHVTRETGANLAARLATSILNGESPGVFFAEFNGGRRDRFSVLLDYQARLPVWQFDIDGGEKGLIWESRRYVSTSMTWMAFYAEDDYERGRVTYSNVHDLVDITHYDIDLDVTDPAERLGLVARVSMTARSVVRAIPFAIGVGTSDAEEYELRLTGATLDNEPLAWSQEDWEGGFTIYLEEPLEPGRSVTIELAIEGKFLLNTDVIRSAFYPLSNSRWLPRHGYLDRATYDLTYTHDVHYTVVSGGTRMSEEPNPENPDEVVTRYRMADRVALLTFAVGKFERHQQVVTFERDGREVVLEYHKLPDWHAREAYVKEEFILAELDNSVRYFAATFGAYPYETFGAVYLPWRFGQGFATLMVLAPADRADTRTFAFLSHETAHQWWGNIVAWRSYRDQWLSEGFAQYSAVLYTGLRDERDGVDRMIRGMRRTLLLPARTVTGIRDERLNDIGPIILGRRLSSTQSGGAYGVLVYYKGALVMRMLHYLLSDPATDPIASNDWGFNRMLTDFVERYRNGAASTDDFRAVANEFFAGSPMARHTGLGDLNWFFRQWLFGTGLPSYRLEYALEDEPDGTTFVTGTLLQIDVPDDWVMPLPLVFTFDDGRVVREVVTARGPATPVEVNLPGRPRRVELDPDSWVLSEKTETKKR
jgi:hypothetical protein